MYLCWCAFIWIFNVFVAFFHRHRYRFFCHFFPLTYSEYEIFFSSHCFSSTLYTYPASSLSTSFYRNRISSIIGIDFLLSCAVGFSCVSFHSFGYCLLLNRSKHLNCRISNIFMDFKCIEQWSICLLLFHLRSNEKIYK